MRQTQMMDGESVGNGMSSINPPVTGAGSANFGWRGLFAMLAASMTLACALDSRQVAVTASQPESPLDPSGERSSSEDAAGVRDSPEGPPLDNAEELDGAEEVAGPMITVSQLPVPPMPLSGVLEPLSEPTFDLEKPVNPATGFLVHGPWERFIGIGSSVSGGTDVNGDGLSDFLIGVPKLEPLGSLVFGRGAGFVVFGRSQPANIDLSRVPNGIPGLVVAGSETYSSVGRYMSSLGDVNGDGLGDFVVSSAFDEVNLGYAAPLYHFVVFGRELGTSPSIDRILAETGDGFVIDGDGLYGGDVAGLSAAPVAPAGDVNGDGLADLVVGSGADNLMSVVFGKATFAKVRLSDVAAGIGGYAYALPSGQFPVVAGVGDVNGDGRSDVAVGSTRSTEPPMVMVYWGRASASEPIIADATSGFEIRATSSSDRFPTSLGAAGDINGDGLDDVLIGASLADGNGGTYGAVRVVFGKRDSTPVALAAPALGYMIYGDTTPTEPFEPGLFGHAVLGAGDIDGDGLDDALIGDPGRDSLYLVFGKTDLAPVQAALLDETGQGRLVLRLRQTQLTSRLGSSIGLAGDANGDGRADFVVGAPNARIQNNGAVGPGAAYVVYSSALLEQPQSPQ